MAIRVIQKITFQRDPEIALHAWTRAVRWAKAEAALFVHQKVVPKHFTPAGAREYHMRERSARYRKRKKGRRGGSQYYADSPLMFTGALRRAMVQQLPTITQSRRGIKVRYNNLPHYLRIRRRNGPDMYAELRRFSTADNKAVFNVLQGSLDRGIEQYKVARLTKRGRGRR